MSKWWAEMSESERDAEFAELQANCSHSWEAGMMIVNDADADMIAEERKANGLPPLQCGNCDSVYDSAKHSIYN